MADTNEEDQRIEEANDDIADAMERKSEALDDKAAEIREDDAE